MIMFLIIITIITMEPNPQLPQSITLDRRKAHSDQITSISIDPTNPNLIATSSDDLTVRIWDLRLNSSVMIVNDKILSQQLSNCVFSDKQEVFVSSGKSVYGFELKKGAVFVSESRCKGEKHLDDINHIAFDKSYKMLGACDDMGDGRLYNTDLGTQGDLDQKHTNVTFCLDFINPENKSPVCVTSGFDCKLVFWDTLKYQAVREIEVGQVLQELVSMHCPPLIYCVLGMQSSVLVGTETGHVGCFNLVGSKQPRLLFEASLNKILRLAFCSFKKNILLSLSSDSSFSLYDYERRREIGSPTFLQKYSTPAPPNWIESTPDNIILVGDRSSQLSIYRLKA